MTKGKLIEKLEALGVLGDYSLDGKLNLYTYILERNSEWDFFFFDERGNRNPIKKFSSEADAYDYIYHYQLELIERRKKNAEEAIRNTEYAKHIHTIVTEVPGEGFVMTKTDRVYIPPEDETDSSKK